MSKEFSLFRNEKINVVKRFYHLDYYYFLIYLVSKDFNTFDDIFKGTIQHQNELSEISNSIGSREKYKTEYQIKSTIDEALRFNLLRIIDKKFFVLTEDGRLLLSYITTKNYFEAEKMICQKMENHYGRPSQLVQLFRDINSQNNSLIVFPKPTPSVLHFSQEQLINGNKLNDYCLACAEYAFKEIYKYMSIEINQSDIYNQLFKLLNSYFERMGNKKQSINIPREVKKIMYSYYIDFFWPDKFDITTFDIWIRRAKELKIINFTEFFPGVNSLIIYPISIIVGSELNTDKFIKMAKTRKGEYLYRYEPKWKSFKEMFVISLWNNYIELSKSNSNFFVPVQDLRDIICFKLQISEHTFATFLGNTYNESMNEIITQFKVSLEVDRSPQERTFVNSKRYPILINNVPKNIIGIKMN